MSTTCGPLYKEGLEAFTGMDPEKIRIFAAGFVSGQAEKLYLGACQCAMFRPSAEHHAMVLRIAMDVSDRYGLRVEQLQTSRGVEIWLCGSPAAALAIRKLGSYERENTPRWHEIRGLMCGISPHQIDREFHKRTGYGERCD